MTNDGSPALELENLSINFGGLLAVAKVDLRVLPGERRAIIGPNGAGKTTLFNLISGDLSPTTGQIRLFGRDITRLPPHRRAAAGMGRTFQITRLFPNLSVWENVLLACQALEWTKFSFLRPMRSYRHLYTRGEELLHAVGVWELRDETIKNLSHGIQRQLEVALALAGRPRVLLLDEPMAGLSPAETHEMTELLRKLDRAMTLLIIEHDMDVVLDLAEHIAVLHLGRKIADGSKDAVRANREVQEIYLGVA
jgi:branched-chain amino acid transport system ATP-binding protein